MEGFTSGRFYSILAKQSRDVTGAIARQKDQAKQLYQKINQQTESLKGLWIAKLNLRGRAAMATPEDLRAFEAKKGEVRGCRCTVRVFPGQKPSRSYPLLTGTCMVYFSGFGQEFRSFSRFMRVLLLLLNLSVQL